MSDTDITPTIVQQFAAIAEALLSRLVKHDAELASAKKADADAEAAVADLTEQLATATGQIQALQQKVNAQLDLSPLQGVMTKMQAAVSAPDDDAPAPSPAPVADPVTVEAPVAPTSVNDLVAADVPEADPAHIAVAVEAHDASVAAGLAPADAHVAATNAAIVAGADPEVATKIADSVATNPPSDPASAAL